MVFVRPSYSSRRKTTDTVNFYAPDYYTFEKDPETGKRIIQDHYNDRSLKKLPNITEIRKEEFRFFELFFESSAFHFGQNCIKSFKFESEVPGEPIPFTSESNIKYFNSGYNEIIINFDPAIKEELIDFISKIEKLLDSKQNSDLNMRLEFVKNQKLFEYVFEKVVMCGFCEYNLECSFYYNKKKIYFSKI